jgi:anti-sigma factor RsiW
MKCKAVRRLLPAYLSDELAADRREPVARHLEGCVACRQEFAALKADAELLRGADAPGPSPYLLTRVMADARATGRPSLFRFRLGVALRTAVATVLVAAGVLAGTMLGGDIAHMSSANGIAEWSPSMDEEPSLIDAYEAAFVEATGDEQ